MIKVKIKYRKVTNPNLAVAKYYPIGYVDKLGKEHISSVIIKVDPILRKRQNKKLTKIILKHESDEIKARTHGYLLKKAHGIAESKEPKWFNKKYRTHRQLQKALRSK